MGRVVTVRASVTGPRGPASAAAAVRLLAVVRLLLGAQLALDRSLRHGGDRLDRPIPGTGRPGERSLSPRAMASTLDKELSLEAPPGERRRSAPGREASCRPTSRRRAPSSLDAHGGGVGHRAAPGGGLRPVRSHGAHGCGRHRGPGRPWRRVGPPQLGRRPLPVHRRARLRHGVRHDFLPSPAPAGTPPRRAARVPQRRHRGVVDRVRIRGLGHRRCRHPPDDAPRARSPRRCCSHGTRCPCSSSRGTPSRSSSR